MARFSELALAAAIDPIVRRIARSIARAALRGDPQARRLVEESRRGSRRVRTTPSRVPTTSITGPSRGPRRPRGDAA